MPPHQARDPQQARDPCFLVPLILVIRLVIVMMCNLSESFHFEEEPHMLLLVAGT